MEITNEIKEKVFAQYLGKPFNMILNDGSFKLGICSLGAIELINKEDVLVLKPLSDITDKDAIEVAKLGGFDILNAEYKVLRIKDTIHVVEKGNDELCKNQFKIFCKTGIDFMLIDNNLPYDVSAEDVIYSYQYLISRGYDLPNYLLGGKTLKESGLAIYE